MAGNVGLFLVLCLVLYHTLYSCGYSLNNKEFRHSINKMSIDKQPWKNICIDANHYPPLPG